MFHKITAFYLRALGVFFDVDCNGTLALIGVITGVTGAFFSPRLVVVGGFLLLGAIAFSVASFALGIHAATFHLEDIHQRIVAVGDEQSKAISRAQGPVPAPDPPRKPN